LVPARETIWKKENYLLKICLSFFDNFWQAIWRENFITLITFAEEVSFPSFKLKKCVSAVGLMLGQLDI
jgi:hypothetical protein